MNRTSLIIVFVLCFSTPVLAQRELGVVSDPGRLRGIVLANGYRHEPRIGPGMITGRIFRDGGLEMRYDIGELAEDYAANRSLRFKWKKEQVIAGRHVVVALSNTAGLYVTFTEAGTSPLASFSATVTSPEDVTDTLLMVLMYPLGVPSSTKPVAQPPSRLGGIVLANGYGHEPQRGLDTIRGRIARDGGLEIGYTTALMAGGATANPSSRFRWKKEQVIAGRRVVVALEDNAVLHVTFTEAERTPVANFFARITSYEDVAEMLMMVLMYPLPPASTTMPSTQPTQ